MLEPIIYTLNGLLTLLAVYWAWQLMFAFKHFKIDKLMNVSTSLKDLPSVSVCIPARNETHVMTECLDRIIASKYPKLEIIVLDDSSSDNTSVLIKSFAHAGVRFVEGAKLPEGWLGRNNALQGLLDEASGSYILYLDVDTQIEPDTIGQLVAYAQQEKASMISVLPLRQDNLRASMIFSTLRYFWTLILHRRSTPATASSAWLIHRHTLRDQLLGFKPYKDDIQPEASLASVLMEQNKYRFLISTPLLGVSYQKKWSSQIETSIRQLFPLLGYSVFRSFLVSVVLLILATPLLALVYGLVTQWSLVQIMALWQLCVFTALYGVYLSRIWRRGWWIGALLWPFIVFQELTVLMISVERYKRHRVTWKGRPIFADKKQ